MLAASSPDSSKKALLFTSAHAIEEARRNPEEIEHEERLENLIQSTVIVPEPPADYTCPISLNKKDVPVFVAALSFKATHFITGDIKHFGKYFSKAIGGIIICTPGEYLRAI